METDEHDSLLPVIATILHLSPDEVRRVKAARSNRSSRFPSLFGVPLWGGGAGGNG
jgi:GRIP domain